MHGKLGSITDFPKVVPTFKGFREQNLKSKVTIWRPIFTELREMRRVSFV